MTPARIAATLVAYMEKSTFAALGLSPEILKAVEALGFEEPSPIQALAIPVLMSGSDAVGQSQTGSGKTAAFAIPAIEKIDSSITAVQVLILCPTRELATQVADEVHKLCLFKRSIHAVPIYGGASYERQFYELKKGVQIVIGTPGRLIDHLDRGTLKLDNLKVIILDEADRMLDMGFREDIQRILDATPAERQTVFFSATISKQIQQLIQKYARDPQSLRIEQKEVTVPTVEQWFYEVHFRKKLDALIRIIDYHEFKLGIIFCNTQRMVDELADTLLAQGYSADRLHGGIAQAQRTRVMNKFKKAEFEFLVATDVAGRGIDVDDLELVVNYDLPYDAEDYVHRIGRTGRAGKRGMAITFASGRDIYKIQFIERFTRTKMQRGKLPTNNEIEEKRTTTLLTSVRTVLEGEAHKTQSGFVERLLEEGFNSTDVASALFHLLAAENPRERTEDPAPDTMDRPQRDRDRRENSRQDSPREPRSRVRDPEGAPPRSRVRDPEGPAREPRSRQRDPEVREKREPRESRSSEIEPREFRKATRGMKWISLDIGKDDGAYPREIVQLIEDASGQPGTGVGAIELEAGKSFIQVPEYYVDILARASQKLNWNGKPVHVGTPEVAPMRTSRDRERPANFRPRSDSRSDSKPAFKKKKW
ncbi:MAG: DEAD/DEAH box helicase [Chthoniobacterales bacterium]